MFYINYVDLKLKIIKNTYLNSRCFFIERM
nr:MAG TPA: Protein of unknown function (DUF3223) [Caudoviricetes sp.]